MKLILASGSPRRRELLSLMGFEFETRASRADEHADASKPDGYVMALAERKARAVKRAPGECVIGADTIVVLDGRVLGKPRDEAEAFDILEKLSGRTHTVYTGVAVLTDKASDVFFDAADVTFAPMDADEIRAYIRTGEPMDKAGAYGIQGRASCFIERIDGSYFTVMGLPVNKLYEALKRLGILPGWAARA